MFSARHPLLRIGLATLGMLLLCLLLFVGLGWMAALHRDWLEKVIAYRRIIRIYNWYAHIADHLAPQDSDGDGCSDGLELYTGMNPRNPLSTAWLDAEWLQPPLRSQFVGEWQHFVMRASVFDKEFSFVPGTLLEIRSAKPAVRLRHYASDPEATTLVIRTGTNGIFEFDLMFEAPLEADAKTQGSNWFSVQNPRSGKRNLPWATRLVGWRGPTIPATFHDEYGQPFSLRHPPDWILRGRNIYVQPPPDDEQAYGCQLEGRPKKPGTPSLARALPKREKHPPYYFDRYPLPEASQLDDYDWFITTILKAPP